MSKRSLESELAVIDALKDEDIDYSDSPALDDSFFTRQRVEWPPRKKSVTIRLDGDVLTWFKAQGRGYQSRINHLLRMYMDAQRQQSKTH